MSPPRSVKEEALRRGLLQDHAEPQNGVKRIDLDGPEEGQWIEYRKQLTGKQTIALLRAQDDFASALEVVGQRIVAHSFGGDILDQPLPVLTRIMGHWNREAESDAVDPPPASG